MLERRVHERPPSFETAIVEASWGLSQPRPKPLQPLFPKTAYTRPGWEGANASASTPPRMVRSCFFRSDQSVVEFCQVLPPSSLHRMRPAYSSVPLDSVIRR